MTPSVLTIGIDDLLAPAASGAPAGGDIRRFPLFEEIKAARRDARANPGEPAPARRVVELLTQGLLQSKDLQLAVWLLEFMSRLEGYRGGATGLIVIRRLLLDYWDTLFPLIDTDDPDPLERRRALLEWVDQEVPGIIKGAPVAAPPASFGLLHYEVTQKTGEEKKALIESGWPTSERFEEALHKSTLKHLETVLADVMTCEAELAALQAVADQRFNTAETPGDRIVFTALKETLASARWVVERPIKQKRKEQGTSEPAASGGDAIAAGAAFAAAGPARNGDELWSQAVELTRGSRVEGLRLMQAHVAAAVCGRDRFLRQLQLAELALEAGIYTLAFPVFDTLGRTIDERHLDEWEDRDVTSRVWTGLARCCELLKDQVPTAEARGKEVLAKLSSPEPTQAAEQ